MRNVSAVDKQGQCLPVQPHDVDFSEFSCAEALIKPDGIYVRLQNPPLESPTSDFDSQACEVPQQLKPNPSATLSGRDIQVFEVERRLPTMVL